MKESKLAEKSLNFAVEIYNLSKKLSEEDKEYIISKQILRSGTSIGANISEAKYAQSKNDFISKLSIAQKEASESEYWLRLLKETKLINEETFTIFDNQCIELIKMLAKSIKTAKQNNK